MKSNARTDDAPVRLARLPDELGIEFAVADGLGRWREGARVTVDIVITADDLSDSFADQIDATVREK